MRLLISIITFIWSQGSIASEPQVASEQKAPLQYIFPNSYGNFSLRHYLDLKYDKEKNLSRIPVMEARYSLGSTFFNKLLNSSITFAIEKQTNSTVVSQKRVNVYAEYTFVKLKSYFLGPYVDLWLPQKGKEYVTQGDMGLFTSFKPKANTRYGTFGFETALDFAAAMTSREQKTQVEEPVSFNLRKKDDHQNREPSRSGDSTYVQKASTLYSSVWTGFSYRPKWLKSLKIAAHGYIDRTYVPKMIPSKSDADDLEQDGYYVGEVASSKVILEYQINKGTYLSNVFYQNFKGRFAAKDKLQPYTNLIMLNVTLF